MLSNIKEFLRKSKHLFNVLENKDIFIVAIVILVALGSFGLGRLSKIKEAKVPVYIERGRLS